MNGRERDVLDLLVENFREFRQEVRDDFVEVRNDMGTVKKDVADLKTLRERTFFLRRAGGVLVGAVLVAIGAAIGGAILAVL